MVVKRTETIEAVKEVPIKFGNYKLRYAWVSQRGYYPDTPHKANQDAHVEIENYCADQGFEDMHLFGVFDGHGSKGTECAQWAAEQVPLELARRLKEHPDDMERCFKEAFLEVNTSLHKNKQIEDRLSGTTAIVVLVNKGTLHIANVGDSRAIVAQLLDSKLAAYSLSQDQTPFRKDERERCKRAGAVIASLDQLEGEEDMHEDWGDTADTGGAEGDDPPRLWLPGQMTPGCAFTRSIGDSVGESIGCIAEPELLTKQLVASDKFLVLASDGVWEFMTNQMVADMVAGFESPLKACKAVVQEAYKLWLQFDVRTDDITMSLVMLDQTEGVEAALLAEQARSPTPTFIPTRNP